MASYEYGKVNMVVRAKQAFKKGSSCLDMGACDGVWYWLLGDYFEMDAVEIFEPYIDKYGLEDLYNHVFNIDIRKLRYKYYDLIIMGDVLEHMSLEDAQKVLNYAYDRCKDFMVALPYNLPQEAINDNENEIHVQADLTPENVAKNYPMLELVASIPNVYGYYHKNPKYKK